MDGIAQTRGQGLSINLNVIRPGKGDDSVAHEVLRRWIVVGEELVHSSLAPAISASVYDFMQLSNI